MIDSMARVSDLTIIRQPVPWPQVRAGADMDDLVAERVGRAGFLRAQGMDLIYLVDPLDGLDRRREDPDLLAAGRLARLRKDKALTQKELAEIVGLNQAEIHRYEKGAASSG